MKLFGIMAMTSICMVFTQCTKEPDLQVRQATSKNHLDTQVVSHRGIDFKRNGKNSCHKNDENGNPMWVSWECMHPPGNCSNNSIPCRERAESGADIAYAMLPANEAEQWITGSDAHWTEQWITDRYDFFIALYDAGIFDHPDVLLEAYE